VKEIAMPAATARCPFLVPVTADHLWLYPVAAYCCAPQRGVRVPASRTLELTCGTASYVECPGFLVRADRDARENGC
jgi:hypothetical protein